MAPPRATSRRGALALAAALAVASAVGPPGGDAGGRSIQVDADGTLADVGPPQTAADGAGQAPHAGSRTMRRERAGPGGPDATEAVALQKAGGERYSESAGLHTADDLDEQHPHHHAAKKPKPNPALNFTGQVMANEEVSWGWWQPYQGGPKGSYWRHLCKEGTFLTDFKVQAFKEGVISMVGPVTCSEQGGILPQHGVHPGPESAWSKVQGWTNYRLKSGHLLDFICLESDCTGGGGKGGQIDKTYPCPFGAKLAGIGGRTDKFITGLTFFCGCPKGMKKRANGKGCESSEKCHWKSWQTWSECSVTCGGGTQGRKRGYHQPKGGKSCDGAGSEVRICNQKECPKK